MAADRITSVVELILKSCTAEELADFEVDLRVNTNSGEKQTVRLSLQKLSKANMVQPVSNESNDALTRRVPSTSTFGKSSSWPILQNALRQPITGMDDINSNVPCPQDTCTVIYDNITTIPCQPAEDKDAHYISTNHSSMPNKTDETIDMTGPFCEGLSGCVDDYSDYSTNQFEAEEGIQIIIPVYCKPQIPQSNWLDDSPLVMQDEPNPSMTISMPTSTSNGSYVDCHSEVAAALPSLMIVPAKEGESSA